MTPLVAVVLHEAGLGGATSAVLRALPALEAEDWRFCFWAPRPGGAAELLTARGYLVAGEPRELRYSAAAMREPPGPWARLSGVPGYLRRFGRFLDGVSPDIVHANTILTVPEALTARRRGVATLLHVHEMLPGGARGIAAARLARSLDGVVSVSQACAAPLRRTGAQVGIVTAGIAAAPALRAPRRADDTLVVGSLATICRRKGSDLFVDAALALLRRRSDVEFRMIGPLASGREERWACELAERARRGGVQLGTTADALTEMAGWDVFVLASRHDPFPLVVLEAMASGLPVVATRVDGIPEQVDDGCAILVAPGDGAALASAIERLLDDPAARVAMGAAGAARAAAHFTPERQARELIAAYDEVLRSGSAGARRTPLRARLAAPARPSR